jgi:hypothetical protein
MKKLPRIFRYVLFLLIAVGVYVGGRALLYWQLEKIVIDKIAAAQSRNISISYRVLTVDYWRGDISIDSLNLRLTVSDTTCRICGNVARVTVKGISILPFLLKKEVALENVSLIRPVVRYDDRYHIPSRKGRKPNSLKGLSVKRITVDSAQFVLADSATEARAAIAVEDFYVRFEGEEGLRWSVGNVTVNRITADFRRALYHLTVEKISYNRAGKEFRLDSAQLIPTEKRGEFARKIGHQVDQFTCSLPLLLIEGFEIDSTEQFRVRATHAGLSFNLEAYRDKRYLRRHQKPVRMPLRVLREMNFTFSVDSVSVFPSYVSYEEFPENGESPGKVFFDDLKASIYNLSNDSSHESVGMHVQSRFMDAGTLNAEFNFPLIAKKPYTVDGSLVDFSMPALNSMLVPAGNIKVESGKMQEMKFRFRYNSARSDGELEVNYTDLKVLSLKKDDRKPNKVVSFLIGLFVKKKIDEKDSKDKRTGHIQWERDSQKGLLNYWWKSVLSGIKSVYNLEGIVGNKDEKSKKQASR